MDKSSMDSNLTLLPGPLISRRESPIVPALRDAQPCIAVNKRSKLATLLLLVLSFLAHSNPTDSASNHCHRFVKAKSGVGTWQPRCVVAHCA